MLPAFAEQGCWLWWGVTLPGGYGRYSGKLVHRWMYEIAVGPIPPEHEIDHLCSTPGCFRPDHLEAVTPQENNRRRRERNDQRSTCKNGHPWTENRFVNSAGNTECRACARARTRECQRRRRAAGLSR